MGGLGWIVGINNVDSSFLRILFVILSFICFMQMKFD